MAAFKSDFMRIVHERGMVHQCSDATRLDELLASGVRTAYIGFDCTANSLHVGSLLQIMMLRWWQKTGHRPITLMGGGTTKVGDPSFRDEARPLLTDEQIDANMLGIKQVFSKYLKFGNGPTDAVMVNNADWLDTLLYIPMLRDVGRHFSVNRMLSMDSVKLRLERDQPFSFLEFNYMILQSYDFVELHKRQNCILQMGGSDQWGNIVMGVDLGRRMAGADLFAVTTPLIATSSGAKMGKSMAGAVWLNAERVSAYDFWQYWRNTEDDDVGRFLKLFTEMPLDEVARLEALKGQEINEAKKILATEITALAHGRKAAEDAAETARRTFEEGAQGRHAADRQRAARAARRRHRRLRAPARGRPGREPHRGAQADQGRRRAAERQADRRRHRDGRRRRSRCVGHAEALGRPQAPRAGEGGLI